MGNDYRSLHRVILLVAVFIDMSTECQKKVSIKKSAHALQRNCYGGDGRNRAVSCDEERLGSLERKDKDFKKILVKMYNRL